MSRNVSFAPGEFYHLYNRGTEKRNIFSGRSDYERFLALLYFSNSTTSVHISNQQQNNQGRTLIELFTDVERGTPLVDLIAYCLMPNHFHLVVREIKDGGVSRFMQKVVTGYTMYFNIRYERSGALFQGKFKARHIRNDNYLKYIMAYVHLNPIKLFDAKWKEQGMRDQRRAKVYLGDYRYSSYLDYMGEKRVQNIVLNQHALPEYFETPKSFKEYVTDWMQYKNKYQEQQWKSKVEP
jgi:putative transposase